ncbi:MAG TPA: serine hydrolase domain-containing protein [Polyangiaceae bacterium]|nr:serine hydrolase domain-containing protein [Polyangiaceae bacterium]
MRYQTGLLGGVLALFTLAAACGGRATTAAAGSGGSGGEWQRAGSSSAGVASSGKGGAGSAGQPLTSGAPGMGAGGSVSNAGAAGSSSEAPGVLRDYLGDPEFPDSFWQPASPGLVDPAPLAHAVRLIRALGWEIHSFLVAKEGRLVFEHYGWNSGMNPAAGGTPHQVLPSERQPQFSTTKSFLSALVGIALAEGALSGLKMRPADSFPDYLTLNPSPEKATITLEDLLTMRSGLDFAEGDQTTFSTADPARSMFSRPVVDTPVGTVWNYSSGGANIIAEMLRVATGQTPLEYGNQKLFGPIGIDSPPWDAGQNGTNFGGFGLALTSREMARFGELFRNSGKWQGEMVVPSAWTDESTAPRCRAAWGGQYGYLWWIPNLNGFFNALGSFGQVIYVSRERGLVIVFTAYMPNDVAKDNLEQLIADYVLPATQ